MTATFPLPLAASGFSVVIAEKVRLSEEIVILGTAPELLPEEPDGEPLLLQALMIRPTLRATDIVTLFLVTAFK
jgi:hypothetical protein